MDESTIVVNPLPSDRCDPLDESDLSRPILRLADRQAFASRGWVQLHDVWTERFAAALADEARARRAHARVPEAGPRTPVGDDGAVHRATPAATGTLLGRLHLSMVGVARALSGRLVVPTFSAYGFYETTDKVLLHVDTDQCEVTLLTTALGRVGQLHLRPDLQGRTLAELGALESNPSWDRSGGDLVAYPTRGFTALAGNVVPHHRPPHRLNELCAVAALCYRSLL